MTDHIPSSSLALLCYFSYLLYFSFFLSRQPNPLAKRSPARARTEVYKHCQNKPHHIQRRRALGIRSCSQPPARPKSWRAPPPGAVQKQKQHAMGSSIVAVARSRVTVRRHRRSSCRHSRGITSTTRSGNTTRAVCRQTAETRCRIRHWHKRQKTRHQAQSACMTMGA